MTTDLNSVVLPIPKKRGPKPGTPGQLRSLANLRAAWNKGQSGNPTGKSKRTLTDALIRKLGRKQALEVARALISEASQGNVNAFIALADRIEGKVAERIEVSGNLELGVRIAAARARRRLAEASGTQTIDVTPQNEGQNEENL